ncbi:GTPase Era, partial [Spirochaetia bacterium 38H-sp]
MKTATCTIIGRPSSGKSTLLNTLCGYKVAITSPVPQTTRNKIRGILTEERGQIIFIDTPGYHHSEKKFNKHLTELVKSSLEETDMVLYLVDSTREAGEEEQDIINILKTIKTPVVCAINKTDLQETKKQSLETLIKAQLNPHSLHHISAITGAGLEKLKTTLFELAQEGQPLYPAEYITDQDPRFRIAEIIREKAILQTKQELPHALYIDILDLEEKNNTLWARAQICVERESQKGIVVGKGGNKIKQIRTQAEKELTEIFEKPIKLDIRVKAVPRWRRNDSILQ